MLLALLTSLFGITRRIAVQELCLTTLQEESDQVLISAMRDAREIGAKMMVSVSLVEQEMG
jgi:hypothetical protein